MNFNNLYTYNNTDFELMKFAICNHNKLVIEKISDERYLTFAKLIRDVDRYNVSYLSTKRT